jgi:hypothetical protein
MTPAWTSGMLFDDISLRTVVMVWYSQAALRIQCLRLQACYTDSKLNAYDMAPGERQR